MRSGRLALAFLVLAVACGGDKAVDPGNNNTTGATGATGNTGATGSPGGNGGSTSNQITIADNSFTPSATTVTVGTTVTWTWTGADTHNVTFDNAGVTGSGDKTSGGSFQKQFNSTGVYTYSCTHHYGMTGSITVQ